MSIVIKFVLIAALSTAIAAGAAFPIRAADLPVKSLVHQHQTALSYGPCGCLHRGYAYHRELRSTYDTGFDPRNFDQTEPRYYFGHVRAYPRYWVDAVGEE
jgi:hypothetical protein